MSDETTEPGAVYFCTQTGVRICAPGVCKAVDAANGQDEAREVDGAVKAAKAPSKPAPVWSSSAAVATDTEGASEHDKKRR